MIDTTDWSEKDKETCARIRKDVAECGAPSIAVLATASENVMAAYIQHIQHKNIVRHAQVRRWLKKHGW